MIYEIWNLIKSNEDVNIPNQKTLIAKQICRDITHRLMEAAYEELKNIDIKASNNEFTN